MATAKASKTNDSTLSLGVRAPDFELLGDDGKTYVLKDFVGTKTIFFFYPKDSTPGCTTEAQDFRDHIAEFEELGARVVGISRDSIGSHQRFREKHSLPFLLLSDPDLSMLKPYQAFGEKVLYGKKMDGIIRSTVVVDEKGKVLAHFPKVRVKGHVEAVLEALRTAK